jgi:DNA-binding GntR family transcriptional regulator
VAKIERPKSLNELVVDRLREAIVSGDYGLGEPLSESRIASDLGTGKGPVRRAIVQLQMEGLVRVVPQSGTFVFSLGAQELEKLNEARFILEEAALRLAVAKNRDGLGKRLAECYSGMVRTKKKGDVRGYLVYDIAFHDAIFAHCENSYLADAYGLVSGKSAALRTHLLSVEPEHTDLSFVEHGTISEAVIEGNLKLALKTLKTHIDRANVGDIAAFDRLNKKKAEAVQ